MTKRNFSVYIDMKVLHFDISVSIHFNFIGKSGVDFTFYDTLLYFKYKINNMKVPGHSSIVLRVTDIKNRIHSLFAIPKF